MNTIINREHWLTEAAETLVKMLQRYAGVAVPQFRVSCGFTGSRRGMRAIGTAWSASAAKDGVAQVYISPLLDEGARVLDVLLHELIHVGVGNHHGHKGPFKKAAKAVGLKGKMTATIASDKLKSFLDKVVERLGDYPHSAIRTQPRTKGVGKGRPVGGGRPNYWSADHRGFQQVAETRGRAVQLFPVGGGAVPHDGVPAISKSDDDLKEAIMREQMTQKELKAAAETAWGKRYCKTIFKDNFSGDMRRFYAHAREVLEPNTVKKTILRYRGADGKEYVIQLHNPKWKTIRRAQVLQGFQRCNGRMVRRSFAEDEVLSLK